MPRRHRHSSTRPVISGQVGSSMALWSAKGTRLSTAQLLSTSNAAHPPSSDCMASSQLTARRSQAACERRAVNWLLAMQSEDGGWAAFDVDNNWAVLNRVPFADHNAM